MVDVKKYEGFFKSFMDEIEMHNYLELLKMAKEANLISEEKYNSTIIKYIRTYEKE